MDEDFERRKAVSQAIAKTILQAYTWRFPKKDWDSTYIIINSLMISLVTILHDLHAEDREKLVDDIINGLLEQDWRG